jgi:hypothetical protein
MKRVICVGFTPIALLCSWALIRGTGVEDHDGMAAGVELSISDADAGKLTPIARLRTEPASRV